FNEFINQGIYKLINPDAPTKFDFTEKTTDPLVYFTILLPDSRFELEKKERNIIETVRELVSFSSQSDFEIYKTFTSKNVEIAQALAILNNSCAKRYLNNLKDIKVLTSGKDLIELGLKPSKEFGKIFDKLVEKNYKIQL
ncbi:hypothetical protein IJV79_03655, partial [bacterium]|nr:hypothetical protein [bacterium]